MKKKKNLNVRKNEPAKANRTGVEVNKKNKNMI